MIEPVLIRNAYWAGDQRRDVLLSQGRVAEVAQHIDTQPSWQTFDALGGALLPGLHDHHLHLAAAASARLSVDCGPPSKATDLRSKLREAARRAAAGDWIRGTAYHESVAGDIDARWLDQAVPDSPLRIQHRSGRLWILNSRALELTAPRAADPGERIAGQLTGRFYEADDWLRNRLLDLGYGGFPDLSALSRELAAYGVVAVTDTSPGNDEQVLAHFRRAQRQGELLQRVRLMGNHRLDPLAGQADGSIEIGELKVHLLDSRLPDLDELIRSIGRSHAVGRGAAFHCVSRTELVFALEALKAAGPGPGDRIEHASVLPPEWLDEVVAQSLTVVTQPAFIAARGDTYRNEVAVDDQPWLYRLRAVVEAGVPLAGSSDAPYGPLSPWLGMSAAMSRLANDGRAMGPEEALTAEQALGLWCGPLNSPGQGLHWPLRGERADLCLIDRTWAEARKNLSLVDVRASWADGRQIWSNPSG